MGTPPDLQAVIRSRVPPSTDLRNQARTLYADDAIFDWYSEPTMKDVPGRRSRLALEGHARYYTPTIQLAESFLRRQAHSSTRRSVYRYIFSWPTSGWPADWPVTHGADILPLFLHPRLPPGELAIARTFVDQLIAFTARKMERMTWREYKLNDRVLNELDSTGEWRVRMEGNGEFNLTSPFVEFWRDVVRSVLDTGRDGWPEIAR